jgi:hypothetical protein
MLVQIKHIQDFLILRARTYWPMAQSASILQEELTELTGLWHRVRAFFRRNCQNLLAYGTECEHSSGGTARTYWPMAQSASILQEELTFDILDGGNIFHNLWKLQFY